MQSLFAKIFFSFWAISIIVLTAVLVGGEYFDGNIDPVDERPPWVLRRDALFMAHVIEEQLQREQPADFAQWLQQFDGVLEFSFFAFSLANRPLEPIDDRRLPAIAARLSPESPVVQGIGGNTLYTGKLIYSNGVATYKLLVALPDPPDTLLVFFQRSVWLRLLIAVLVSGVGCYMMALLSVNSILSLRQVTRQLAAGNLNARIKVKEEGGDEIEELSRDFNHMADRLQHTIDDQKQLVRDISHELRSPLSRIQTALAIAQRRGGDCGQELERVERECERLNELISQLLAVPDRNIQLEDTVDLCHLLENVVEDNVIVAQQANKRLTLQNPFDPPLLLRTHGDLLYRAVDNLVRNALRHTPVGTEVQVHLQRNQKEFIIAVRDSGSGVDEAELSKIFQPFYRLQTARERSTGGYGLGLSIAQRAIAQHRGQIDAKNLPGGFQVSIHLPRSLQINNL